MKMASAVLITAAVSNTAGDTAKAAAQPKTAAEEQEDKYN